ncbi:MULTISPECIES: hypothetical protein [Methylobacterium]|uniref:hypothetical protein n=1 Tax=Methylobacterium TaxID=407 RepID=UPI00272EC9E4|nr:hypothetical protein [Methylobacterium sp.]
MTQRWARTALATSLLTGGAMATAPALAAPAAARAELPSEACKKTEDGFGEFLNAIVSDPALRAAYSASPITERDLRDPARPVARPGEPFRVTIVDNMWFYDEPGRSTAKLARIKLTFKIDGNRMRLGFVKAKFSPEDDLIRTFGAPEAYVFEHIQGCWRLVEHLR